MTAIENKVSQLKTNDLIEMVEGIIKKESKEADMVLDIILDVLMDRMDDDNFLALCNQIEEVM